MQEYPLDIALLCSVALQGALVKYSKNLPVLPNSSKNFISEWNKALIATVQEPNFKKHLGALGRAISLVKNPAIVASGANKVSGVPYRSFYYASRFANAFVFTRKNIVSSRADCEIGTRHNIVNFGNGLSPLTHLVKQEYDFVTPWTIDLPLINEVYEKTSLRMGLKSSANMINWDELGLLSNSGHNIFISLGTFVYLDKDDQADKLKYINENFKHIFIELELDKAAQDANITKKMGAGYNKGWDKAEVPKLISDSSVKLMSNIPDMINNKLWFKCAQATEMFVTR